MTPDRRVTAVPCRAELGVDSLQQQVTMAVNAPRLTT